MSGEGFLSRWSRRKRAVEEGAPVEEPQAAPPPAPAEPAAPTPIEPEEPAFDLAALPSIESLTAESDFAAFLHKAVPEGLRRAALRKAWALDPAIRDFVGLADYAWDYNAPDGVPGAALNLTGDVKGMVARIFAAADGAAPEASPAEAVETPGTPEAEPVPDAGEHPLATLAIAEEAAQPDPVQDEAPPRRRHGSALPS